MIRRWSVRAVWLRASPLSSRKFVGRTKNGMHTYIHTCIQHTHDAHTYIHGAYIYTPAVHGRRRLITPAFVLTWQKIPRRSCRAGGSRCSWRQCRLETCCPRNNQSDRASTELLSWLRLDRAHTGFPFFCSCFPVCACVRVFFLDHPLLHVLFTGHVCYTNDRRWVEAHAACLAQCLRMTNTTLVSKQHYSLSWVGIEWWRFRSADLSPFFRKTAVRIV